MGRLRLDQCLEIRKGPLGLVCGEAHVTALDPNAEICWIEANRLVQIGQRSVGLASPAISVRTLGVVFRKAGLQTDDLAEIRDLFIILPLREENPSATLTGERLVAGIDARRVQRARAEFDALLELFLLLCARAGGEDRKRCRR